MSRFQISIFILLFTTVLICAQRAQETVYFCEAGSTNEVTIPEYFMQDGISQKFRTKTMDLKCPNASQVQTNVSLAEAPTFLFYPTGEIVIPHKDYFLSSEFCIKRLTPQSIEVHSCEVKCGITHTCVHKCCPPNQLIDFSPDRESPCSLTPTKMWKPVFYAAHEGCGIRVETEDVKYHLFPVMDTIDSFYVPYKHIHGHIPEMGLTKLDGFRFRLMVDGHLMSQNVKGKWETTNRGEFCIDGMTGFQESDIHSYKHIEDQVYISMDRENASYEQEYVDDEVQIQLAEYLYTPLMCIGAVFLLLTSLLHIIIWEKHNIHGWTIFAFVTTMFFMFVFLATSKIFSLSKDDEFGGTPGCKTVGVLAHLFYLSTICWLSVINLDLWLTFRNIKPGGGTSQNVTRFALYSLFAFGVPLLIVTFAVTMDFMYLGSFGDGTECEPPVTLPLYGQLQCYMQHESQLYYLYIPMAILLTYNILTFSSTVFSLCMYRNQTRNATTSASNQNESLVLFGKLFIVTGISWVLELISYALPDLWWFWIVFDTYNLLQTVLIFIIFALKRENIIFLYQKYPSARFLLVPIMRTPCCYSDSFDPEKTDLTTVPFDQRHSRIHFRRGSNTSTSSRNVVTFK